MIATQTFRKPGCALALCGALSLAGQTVTAAGNAAMRFDDPNHGVAFRYAAAWSFSEQPNFYSLSIASESAPVRGEVFLKGFPGIKGWPDTDLDGVEFAYAVRENLPPEECRRLASLASHESPVVDERTINGILYHHGWGESGGMSHDVKEDVYTSASGNSCLLFDLATHYVGAPSATQTPRNLTAQELATVNKALQEILASVKSSPPNQRSSQPSKSAQ